MLNINELTKSKDLFFPFFINQVYEKITLNISELTK